MKNFLFLLIGMLVSLQILSQDKEKEKPDSLKKWKFAGMTNLTFTQLALKNWAAGGENSYSLNGLVNLNANYKHESTMWENTLQIGYGIMKQESYNEIRKTDDKIDFVSKFGYKAASKWNYSAMLNFKTQMDAGYDYAKDEKELISEALSPAYLIIAVGMEYRPNDAFYLQLSPITGKTTFVTNDSLSAKGAYGVEKGETVRSEFGGYVKIAYKKEIFKNATLSTNLDLFSNYLNNPQNIDVNWENMLTLKVNDFLSANLFLHFIYDDDIDIADPENPDHKRPALQQKEVFGLGFSYKF